MREPSSIVEDVILMAVQANPPVVSGRRSFAGLGWFSILATSPV